MSALIRLLPEEGASFLEVAGRYMEEQVAPRVLDRDAGLGESEPATLDHLVELGLVDILAFEELGSPSERLALLLATGRTLGQTDAGLAMAALTLALTGSVLGTRVGFGVEVMRPQGSGVVALAAGQDLIALLDTSAAGRLVPLAGQGTPLLGLRLGGGQLLDLPAEVGTALPAGAMDSLRDQLSLAALAVAIGVAEGSLGVATDYAGIRTQGGALISRHHAVRALLRGMRERVDLAGILLVSLLGEVDPSARPHLLASAMAACDEAVTDGVQVLGGYGYMREYGQEKRMRDVRTLRLLFGPLRPR